MAAYRQVYGFGHLQADCRGPGSAQKPYVCFEYGTTSLLLLPLSSKGELLGTAEAGILQAGFLSCHLTISVTEGKFWWKNKALFFVLFSNLLARVDNGISRRGWYQSRDLSSPSPSPRHKHWHLHRAEKQNSLSSFQTRELCWNPALGFSGRDTPFSDHVKPAFSGLTNVLVNSGYLTKGNPVFGKP